MRARPAYWLALALVTGASLGLRALALQAQQLDDWQPAVYRYPADGMPTCADLSGPASSALRKEEQWSRILLPDARRLSPRGCMLLEHLLM